MGWGAIGAAFAGGAGSNMPSPSRTILERRDRAESHDWAVEDAWTERRWQEQMSNTAHQREVEDLKKAGLNPILSATGGSGASSPSGSGVGPAEDIDYSKGVDISSALDVIRNKADISLMKAQEHAANSAADVSKAAARKTNKEADILGPKSFLYDKVTEALKSTAKDIDFIGKELKNPYQVEKAQPRMKGKP